jgi:drug/metabolite transporter (DMT)-like permease
MWIIFALLAPFLFALVHVLDAECVDKVLEKPWMGMITSAIATLFVLIPIPYFFPFFDWTWPSWQILTLTFLAGALIQISQGLYFQSLSYSEAGIVSAYWNLIPIFVAILSVLLFYEVLSWKEYLGMTVIVLSSTVMIFLDTALRTGIKTFFTMIFAALMQSISYISLNYVYDYIPFLQAFTIMTSAIIIVGMLPLTSTKIRSVFKRNIVRLHKHRWLFIIIELINVGALFSAQKAIALGNPSLVTAVETTIPAFAFGVSGSLFLFTRKFGDRRTFSKLHLKILMIIFMTAGILLLY